MSATRSVRAHAAALSALTALTAVAALATACAGPDDDAPAAPAPQGDPTAASPVTWTDGDGDGGSGDAVDSAATAAAGALVQGRVDLEPGTTSVTLALTGAYPVAIPPPCAQSDVKTARSSLDGRVLFCALEREVDRVAFTALVDGGEGTEVGGEVTTEAAGADPVTSTLPGRVVSGGSVAEPDLRLVSSPDFLNADVGDLRDGPGSWDPTRSTNGTNASYERVLDRILDDWADLDPAAVLVAGDLVNGRWGFDDQGTGTFGPVGSFAERRDALVRAARTYYPQWQRRFDEHGLLVTPSIGDHEYGDNPFGGFKRLLARTAREEFARQFTLTPDGEPRYADRPEGPARLTAFAGRPTPDLQVVSLDVFDVSRDEVRIRLDPQQLAWLEDVLARAQRDGVRWTIVESHVPIAFPVRNRASSALHYEGGTDSDLWQLMRRYDVDVYLSGEVHDSQLADQDGIVQVSHGGAFQFGLTTALVLDFYGDNLYLQLRDYDIRKSDRFERLWETRREGMPSRVSLGGPPRVIGTASVDEEAGLVSATGILTPVRGPDAPR